MAAAAYSLCRIALRNLGRHKMKTFITCFAIMLSVTLYIWMESWLKGMNIESRRNIVNYETGAAKIQTRLYFEKKDELPGYENFPDWEKYAAILGRAGYRAAPRYTFSGTIYSMFGSAPLVVHGIEPAIEAETLAYPAYVEFGRFIKGGEFALALGAMTAEKLKAGIPVRPLKEELEALVREAGAAGAGEGEQAFIRGCYEELPVKDASKGAENRPGAAPPRMGLKRGLTEGETGRLWNLIEKTGRNDVKIAAVIDYKLAPQMIRPDKWEAELWEALPPEDRDLMAGAYEYDEFTDRYLLTADDPLTLGRVLEAMVRAGFSGAVRHVNQVISAKVAGIINSPDPANNFNVAYMPLQALQGEEGMMLEGRVTELIIRDSSMGASDMTSNREDPAVIRSVLEQGLAEAGAAMPPELGVFSWADYVKDYLAYEKYESGSSRILSILLFFLALIGISNTILLSILERTREIGMMRALGMTDSQMILAYMLEACFIGLIGSVLGVMLGCAVNYPTVKYGIDFSEMLEKMGGNMGYRVSGNFRSVWDIPTIIGAGAAATALSALMALLPACRAVGLRITDSLRFE
ncbi:MAG: FtsX-like permease family protein [Spirochaetaceae bacterium]|jgi:ABC-type lipoprotein release transport system permease subunit|nr:FtsX-like permease family protein [Spirochaetaceae bacterium]